MTYFTFLFLFLTIPIAVLGLTAVYDQRHGRRVAKRLNNWAVLASIGLHVLIALIYTTPWDNYLVATEVWWYDPQLVTGLTIGWVPIEEYTFFVLQPILAGLWWWFLARRLNHPASTGDLQNRLRYWMPLSLALVWLGSVIVLATAWQPGTYLALELAWALPPIALQFAYGADILWRYKKLVGLGVLVPTLYLAAADVVAISAGTWTISPGQSLGLLLGGILPVEELVFFLLTNTLVVFGVTLIQAEETRPRMEEIRARVRRLRSSRSSQMAGE